MALSKSFHKGQVPICCQMCEESNEIKWKCLQCDFLLCTKCQKLHRKVKSSDQHTIINIKDIASQQRQPKDNSDFSNIPCQIHNGQHCCLVCQTCEEVVCPLCITKVHNKHNMIEIIDGYKLTVDTIKTFNSELDRKLTNNIKGIYNLQLLKSLEDFKYEEEKQKILRRDEVLKCEVEKHTTKLLKELDMRREHLTKSVYDQKNTSQTINKDLEFRRESLTHALASVHTTDVFGALNKEKIARKQSNEPTNTYIKRLPQFVPGTVDIPEELHGKLTESEIDYAQENYLFKVMTKYKTELKLVEMIVFCNDTLWISNFTIKSIQKIQFVNGLVNVVQEVQIHLVGMALLKSGDLLISTGETILKILSNTTGKIIQSKYSVSPMITGAVHVTLDNKIILRTRNEGPVFPVSGPRQVVVMDIDGRTERIYDLDNNGKSIFNAPQRITTDNDNNIYILDSLNEHCGRILALDNINDVRWKYNSVPDMDPKHTFKPSGLLVTKSEKIIIIDCEHQMMHILNTSGQCLHYLNTMEQLGIKLPFSVDMNNRGILYIGCNTKKQEPDEAKLYTVQVSGF